MNITKNIKKIPDQNSHSLRNHSNIIISSDYSLETLYQILSKNPLLVNQTDNKGGTLLSYSIERDKKDIFDLILTSPILDLNYQDKEGNSYLHKAVQFERENMIIDLIKKGISLNTQNNDGNTPLHLAYYTGNKNIQNYLLENNIDYTIKNNNGEIADISIRDLESNNNDNPLMNDNIMNENDSEIIEQGLINKQKNENEDSEIIESIKIEWSGSNLIKKNRQLNLSIPNNFNSFENLKSQMIPNKKKEENYTEDTKSNSPKYITNNSNQKNKNNYNEEEPNDFNMSSSFVKQKDNYDRIYQDKYNMNEEEDIVNFNRSSMKRFNTTNFYHPNNVTIRKNSSIIKTNLVLNKPQFDNENFRFSSPYENNMGNNFIYNDLKKTNNSQISKFTIPNINLNPNPVSSIIFKNNTTSINEKPNLSALSTFLKSIDMEKYYINFISNGFDDIQLIINQTKDDLGITDNNLIEAGVYSPGDRAKIIIKVQELAGNFSYQIPKEVYYKCNNVNDIENDKCINKLNNWLKEINLESLLNNFISNGYYSLELLLIQLDCKEPLNIDKLKNDLNIEKIGFRQRIMNKLKDDKRKLVNRLKKNLVIMEQSDHNICHDCKIF